jgi:hypothetical protein
MSFKVGDKVLIKGTSIDGTIANSPSPEGTYAVYITDRTGSYTSFIKSDQLVLELIPNGIKLEPLTFIDEGSYLDHLREKETVAKPTRYNTGSIEVWDAIAQLGADYLQGNVIKYTMRYKHKNKAEDLKKAMNYLAKMLSEETGEDYYELRKKTLDEL